MERNCSRVCLFCIGVIGLILEGCGGSGSTIRVGPPPPATYAVDVTVLGLWGTGGSLVLTDNDDDPLPVTANGIFTFPTALQSGATYSVTVLTQPASPAQTCVVTGGSGTVHANGAAGLDFLDKLSQATGNAQAPDRESVRHACLRKATIMLFSRYKVAYEKKRKIMRNVASVAEITKSFFAEIDKSRLTLPGLREHGGSYLATVCNKLSAHCAIRPRNF